MIEKFKDVRFEFHKQTEEYDKLKSEMSKEEKYKLIEEIKNDKIWNYFQLAVEILFDLASDEDEYFIALEEFHSKIKRDMVSGSFFNMLIRIGKEKPDIAINLYYKMQEMSKDDDLKIVSGLILGAYATKDEGPLNRLLEKIIAHPTTNTALKAILVRYENETLPADMKEYLDKVFESNDERILKELMNIYLSLYKNDKDYFYEKIKALASKKIASVNYLLFYRLLQVKMDKERELELIELFKDSDAGIIDEMMHLVTKYPEETERLGNLFLYWINKDLLLKSRSLTWGLEEVVKKNPEIIEYFFNNYKILDKKTIKYFFSELVEVLSKVNTPESIKQLLVKNIEDENPSLFYEVCIKIIGNIYPDGNQFDNFIPLSKKIHDLGKGRKFISVDDGKFANLLNTKNYDELINYTYDLLKQLQLRKEDYDFSVIDESLKEFGELRESVKEKIAMLKERNIYTPLLSLAEKDGFRDEVKKAYLFELDDYFKKIKVLKNKKISDNVVPLVKSLGDENRFWERVSEIFLFNRFLSEESFKPTLEPSVPYKDNNADLSIELVNKKAYFEIKKLWTNRNLELDNKAVEIKNKARGSIYAAYNQLQSSEIYENMKKGKCKDLFFIVLDLSNSIADEYDVLNALYGSLGYQWFINKETNESTKPQLIRHPDSLGDKKERAGILSGVIFFKTRLEKLDDLLKIKLVGDIILNPKAINVPSEDEVKKLKEIIFK